MKKNKQSDVLILEIMSILSENRCSYSESQEAALNEVIKLLEEGQFSGNESDIDWNLVAELVKVVIFIYFNKNI